jgi:glycosyltransferase involved in cell wall biosynthesis
VDEVFFSNVNYEIPNRILFVGYVEPRKGIFNLVKAINQVKNFHKNIKLIVVGKATDINYLRRILQYITNNDLCENIVYKGIIPREDLIEEYQKCSIFILPSLIEPFGIVLLEAMASRKPIIASNVGGIPFFVKNNETGFLVDKGSYEELSKKILLLLDNEELRYEMGVKGYLYSQKYKWDVVHNKTIDFYKEIMKLNHIM